MFSSVRQNNSLLRWNAVCLLASNTKTLIRQNFALFVSNWRPSTYIWIFSNTNSSFTDSIFIEIQVSNLSEFSLKWQNWRFQSLQLITTICAYCLVIYCFVIGLTLYFALENKSYEMQMCCLWIEFSFPMWSFIWIFISGYLHIAEWLYLFH